MMRRSPYWHSLRLVDGSAQDRGPRDDAAHSGSQLMNSFAWSQRMYAIAFDLDTEMLERHYPGNSRSCAYGDIERVFAKYGFKRQQGSLFFGDARVATPVQCVLAIQELVKKHPWFRPVVRDIRMLRIDEQNDLMPAVGDFELPLAPPVAAAE
jgi:virulence-associated protein VapD